MYDFTTILNRFGTGSRKWDEMRDYGITDNSIIPMSTAEMEFDNAPEIKAGLAEYARSAVLSYFDPQPDYFETVRMWQEKRHGFKMPVEAVIPNNSLHAALATSIMAYTAEGEGVLVMVPVWPSFFAMPTRLGRRVIFHDLVEKDCIYSIDFDRLDRDLATPGCKMMLLCSPHNPVGRSWTREELETIVSLCAKHGVTIVSDEIHADLTLPGYRHIPIASVSEEAASRTVTFTSASKAFNLAGLDTASVFIINPELRRRYFEARRKEGLSSPNMLGLKACELAYKKGAPWLDECVATLAENAAYVTNFIKTIKPEIRCSPLQATYLMWLDFRSLGLGNKELEEGLVKGARIFVDCGYHFGNGGEGFVRMNIACPLQAIAEALDRVKVWVETIK